MKADAKKATAMEKAAAALLPKVRFTAAGAEDAVP